MSDHLMSNYKQLPVAFERGEGVWLIDNQGQRYLDALSGIAVCNLGHAHPVVSKAISQQADRLLHTSNFYHIPAQERLAERLAELSLMDKIFFCNSGAEANEAAIKIARLYGHHKSITTPKIIVAEGSFHGRTMATLSATGNRKVQSGFEPLLPGFIHVPFNDIAAMHTVLSTHRDVVAIMLEPVQGEGGINLPDDDYLKQVRQLCDNHDLLFILDEIQTGMCRTGHWFAHQEADIRPDVMTLAKALGNGVPIGACLARGRAADIFQPGSHGSTFGGNPLAARAAMAVIDVMTEQDLAQQAAEVGQKLLTDLTEALAGMKGIKEIRGKGLMIGIEMDKDCLMLVNEALKSHLLINVTAGKVIRLLPPLVIKDNEADQIVESLTKLVIEHLQEKP